MSTLRLWKETDMSPCFLLISDLYRKLFSTLNIILLLDDGDLPQQYIVSYPEMIVSLILSFESNSILDILSSG